MHAALRIDEILADIAYHQNDPKGLTAMALACKAFYNPAMGELWRTVDDIHRLILLLPTGIIHFGQDVDSEGVKSGDWSVLRTATAEEWNHFDQHARRVRELCWDTSNVEMVDPDVNLSLLDIMKVYYGQRSAFPRLQALTVNAYCVAKIANWTVLASPGLRKLAAPFVHLPMNGAVILPQICLTAQSICTLRLKPSITVNQEAIRIIAQMPRLRQLHLTAIDTIFSSVGRLQGLRYPTFPALQELQLSVMYSYGGGDVDLCRDTTSFLRLISSRSVNTLQICHADVAPTQDSLCAMLKAMAQFSDTLTTCSVEIAKSELRMVTPQGPRHGSSNSAIPLSAFFPSLLLLGKALTCLNLSYVPLDINRHSLYELLHAYSAVTTLRLGETHPNTSTSLSPDDIPVFAARCRRLERLGIPAIYPPEGTNSNTVDSVGPSTSAPSTHLLQKLIVGLQNPGRLCEVHAALVVAQLCFPQAEIRLSLLLPVPQA
ncbi:hypothetical protein PHLGIDRAFT_119747 [Phlebiopsis gigantea 11061_1 CR5-6]|uniref:F-box domain-containing protein n=1 Tax=Phlebiopsis gigantea (strain 11061_1 CR5-6) TaxID=745531 RepID=A0A0C3RVU6_PHLG1|nr:hypothetical protein PHLGIDRAFT_119747 [Phlebiopsis gigantea 11061_1 CR5-6]